MKAMKRINKEGREEERKNERNKETRNEENEHSLHNPRLNSVFSPQQDYSIHTNPASRSNSKAALKTLKQQSCTLQLYRACNGPSGCGGEAMHTLPQPPSSFETCEVAASHACGFHASTLRFCVLVGFSGCLCIWIHFLFRFNFFSCVDFFLILFLF